MTTLANWQMCCLNIQNAGIPLIRASRMIGRNDGYLSHLARGEVTHVDLKVAIDLLDLHFDVCGREKTAALHV